MNNAPQKKSPVLKIISLIIILVALGAAVYLPKLLDTTPPENVVIKADPKCDISRASCSARHAESTISLVIDSEKVQSATPMKFVAELANIEADQVMLDLKGRDMFMGLNQVMLSQVSGTDRWQGEATLAVCTTGEMTWVASVITEKNGVITQADFEFTAR